MLIDSHTHLYDPAYDSDREEVFRRAEEAGVKAIIAVGCDLETSRRAVGLAENRPEVYATVGVHPHEAKAADAATLAGLEILARKPKVVGFGEIGLDYHYMHSSKEDQLDRFRTQIRLGRGLNLPLVVHSRAAKEDTLRLLSEEGANAVGGVLHCFTGDLEMAQAAIEMNFFISFSGVLTFANAGALREVARSLPLNRVMIETDCPFLAPVPHRGKRNEPARLRETASVLASLHPSRTASEVEEATSKNAVKLFRLPLF